MEDVRGSARLSRLAPGILLFVCTGTLPPNFYEPMVAVAQREMDRHGAVVMFVDGWELHSVATDFRESWTAWFKAHKKSCRMHLLVRTKLMEMAASLAGLFVGAHLVTSLLMFNVGVELGQVLALLLLVPLLDWTLARMNERIGVIVLSSLVAHTGWHWMLERYEALRQFRFERPALDLFLLAGALRWAMLLLVGGALAYAALRFLREPARTAAEE